MNEMLQHFAPPQGFYTSKPPEHPDHEASPFSFAAPPPTDPPSPGPSRPRRLSGSNRGGRPKDFVWSFFAGDRDKAVCKQCSWSTERPKAFRMRQHILTCPRMPDDVKESVKQAIDSKEQTQRVKEDASGRPASKGKKRKTDKFGNLPTSLRNLMEATPTTMPASVVTDPTARSPVTCHVTDSTSGKPGAEMQVHLDYFTSTGYSTIGRSWTDGDGRCNNLLLPGMLEHIGTYRLTFHTGEYFEKRGISTFYPVVEITFNIANPTEHFHLPLLLSPFGYSTYRGS